MVLNILHYRARKNANLRKSERGKEAFSVQESQEKSGLVLAYTGPSQADVILV